MSEQSPADRQILAILQELRAAAEDGVSLEAGELDRVRAILKHGPTLVKIAQYEEAKGVFWAHWRGLILAAGAVITALAALTSKGEKLFQKLAAVFS